MSPRILAVAVLGAILLGALLAWLSELLAPEPAPRGPRTAADGPAPWEVAQLLEEARRITRDAL